MQAVTKQFPVSKLQQTSTEVTQIHTILSIEDLHQNSVSKETSCFSYN